MAKIQEAILNFHNNGNLVNSSTCFKQQNDISMANYNDQCGWEGNWYQIGLSASYPFTGYYAIKEDLGADSLDLFELVMALEDEYSVEIPAEDLEQLTTVGEVMNYLKAKGVEA